MRKYLLITLCCLGASLCKAQISGPDTVVINTIDTFSSANEATSYSWFFDSTSTVFSSSLDTDSIGGSFSVPAFSKMVNDNGHWYCFVTNYGTSEIMRLDYGTDPKSTPMQSVIATPTFTFPSLEGIEIVKDGTEWYGFAVSGNEMVRLDFGTSLSTTPSDTLITLAALSYPHQISINKFGSNWIGFVGDRVSGIIRLDFGTSVTSVPATTQIPVVGSYDSPCNFSLYKEGTAWYMLATNLINKTVTRIEFGSNIQNNTPTGTLLGSPSLTMTYLRSINIVPGCNQLYAYVMDESGSVAQLDFRGSILNTPDTAMVATFPNIFLANSTYPFIYDHSINFMMVSSYSNTLYRYSLLTYSHPDSTVYYQQQITHRFTTLGWHYIALNCDPAVPTGPSAYCKGVYVRAPTGVHQIGTPLVGISIYPNPASNSFNIKGKLNNTENTTGSIEIINSLGQRILTTDISIKQGNVDQQIVLSSSIPSGNYFVRIITQSEMQIQPLTITR